MRRVDDAGRDLAVTLKGEDEQTRFNEVVRISLKKAGEATVAVVDHWIQE